MILLSDRAAVTDGIRVEGEVTQPGVCPMRKLSAQFERQRPENSAGEGQGCRFVAMSFLATIALI